MYRTLGALALVIGATVLAVGLSLRASVQDRAEFTFVNGTEPRTLDPALMTGRPEGRVAWAIFEGLTRRDAKTLQPVPGVAESWERSADGRTYVFHLRPDARWSDGRPLTAHDFAWSWRRLLDPSLGAEYAYILYGVRHAEAFHTHRAQAAALRGEIATALEALQREHPGGVGGDAWLRFVGEHRVRAAVQGTPDPRLRAQLEAETLPAEGFAPLGAALLAEADRRETLAARAERHLGVDQGVYARDERTLVVELVAATPYFLELTAFFSTAPVPRHVVEAPGNALDWFLPGKIVSNGPFELELWRVGDRIRLRRSPTYWGRDEVGVETIDILPIENTTTGLNLYLTGAIDWLPEYPTDLVDVIRRRPDHTENPAFTVYYYRINTRRPPLDDPRVRQALALAIDREQIVRDVLRQGQLPAHHIVPPGLAGYRPPPSGVRLDRERARELLAEAGFPGGAGFPELGILYNTDEDHKQIAEVIADQLQRHLGIRVVPYNQEWQAYLATLQAGEYDLARAGWIGDYLDPNTFLDIWITNGGNNQTGWGDPDYDRLIAAAADVEGLLADPAHLAALPDASEVHARVAAVRTAEAGEPRRRAIQALRLALLREAEAMLVQDAFPFIPIYFYVEGNLVRPEVEGFYATLELEDGSTAPNLQDIHPLRSIRVRRP